MAQQIDEPSRIDPSDDGVVLLLQVPRTNEKKELAAEQMFASLHGLLTMPRGGGFFKPSVKRERLVSRSPYSKNALVFTCGYRITLKVLSKNRFTPNIPTVQISEVPDFTMTPRDEHLSDHADDRNETRRQRRVADQNFQSFEVDPLAAITATLAKFEDDEEAWIQLVHASRQPGIGTAKASATLPACAAAKPRSHGLLTALWSPPTP